jgi:small conductance mechanosensitive channel
LLSNFAAGIFLVVLRPFKVGDFISAGGITGTVE